MLDIYSWGLSFTLIFISLTTIIFGYRFESIKGQRYGVVFFWIVVISLLWPLFWLGFVLYLLNKRV